MKNIFLILITLLFVSCSSDDSDYDKSTFHPPEWIIGTWNHEYPDAILKTYVISVNNVTVYNPENHEINYSNTIKNDPSKTLIEIEISDKRYYYNIQSILPNGTKSNYEIDFKKVSDTELTLYNASTLLTSTYFKEK